MTFFKNIYLMTAGTSISQIIIIFCSPVLTRLYPPEAFGVYKIFVSITAILTVVANLRYELAIVLPEKKLEALTILKLSLVSNTFISFIILLLVIPSYDMFGDNTFKDLGNLKYLIPLSVFFGALLQALNFWFNRLKQFKNISISKVIRSSCISLIQILIGWALVGNSIGLIFGSIAGQLFSLFYFICIALKDDDLKTKPYFNKDDLSKVASLYKRFPYFSSPGAFFNRASSEFPVFIISFTYGLSIVGQYSLAIRLLGLPLTLISSSIFQVLVSKIAELNREEPRYIKLFLARSFVFLFVPAISIAVFFSNFSESIFTIIFGSQWLMAGEIASIIVFAYAFKFSISPLSAVFGLEKNVHLGFYWQALYFVSIIITLFLAKSFDLMTFVKIFTFFEIVLYIIYLFFIFFGSRKVALESNYVK